MLGIGYYHVGHTEWLEGFSPGSPINNYNRVDLTARYRFQLDTHTELETSLVIQNLFDHRYSEFYRYNDFDRRTYLQFKISR